MKSVHSFNLLVLNRTVRYDWAGRQTDQLVTVRQHRQLDRETEVLSIFI